MTEAGKDGGFSFKNLFKKTDPFVVGASVLSSGCVKEATEAGQSFEAPKPTTEAFVKAEDTTANTVENGQVNLHMDPEKALENLKQKTNEIASDHLAAQMGANTQENGTDLHITDEQALNSLEQKTAEIASDHLAAQMGANTTNEKPNIDWHKTDEQIMQGVEQKTKEIASDQMLNSTTRR